MLLKAKLNVTDKKCCGQSQYTRVSMYEIVW